MLLVSTGYSTYSSRKHHSNWRNSNASWL